MPDFTTNDALVLNTRPLGENTFIVTLFTSDHGRHLGVFKKKNPPQIGTLVQARWKARLADQMGTFYLEETKALAPLLMDDRPRLNVLTNLCALLDKVLPERQVFESLHADTLNFLNTLFQDDFYTNYVRFEVLLLEALGFALDMSSCAGGGDKNDLAYISPKTGRAISHEKGQPYHDKLLPLPRFLWQNAIATPTDLLDGLAITAYFLQNYLLGQMPSARTRLIQDIQRIIHG